MKWPTIKFEKLYSGPSRNGIYKQKQFHGSGVRIVNMGELFAYDIISDQEMKRVAMTDAEMARSGLMNGDLLFGRRSLVEAGAGKCSLVEGLSEPATFESSLIRVRVNEELIHPRFIFYWLKSHVGRGAIRAIVTGTNVKGIRGSVLKDIEVICPPFNTQNKIVDILQAYDDLIENNQRRMKLLEDSARLLYQEWFVRLRFPGHEHVKIIDGVPKGWERKQLSEISQLNNASLSSSFEVMIEYIDIASVSPGQINETTSYEFRDAPSRARRILRHGDIIWSCVRPNRRSHAIIWQPPDNLIGSTGFVVITPQSVPTTFLYYATTTDAFVGHLENVAKGVAYPAVLTTDFECSILLIPPSGLLKNFNEFVEPAFQQIKALHTQNQKLKAARDLLLPKLMNGEIEV